MLFLLLSSLRCLPIGVERHSPFRCAVLPVRACWGAAGGVLHPLLLLRSCACSCSIFISSYLWANKYSTLLVLHRLDRSVHSHFLNGIGWTGSSMRPCLISLRECAISPEVDHHAWGLSTDQAYADHRLGCLNSVWNICLHRATHLPPRWWTEPHRT